MLKLQDLPNKFYNQEVFFMTRQYCSLAFSQADKLTYKLKGNSKNDE
ncbi:hypothetical protein M23134_00082 [Microscilla marina ATCC 23134]|uniref:Uncharacterized protein n=1 Tax=Microscilla marina ATCC 23134 TaxID=313606 RepID=A1ZKW2_MICM2|nr:hypothetical protein M23134_00082 [Microscilla marina ATCC 23134]